MADFATTDDLEDRLGRDLTAAEAAKAPAMLRDATAKIRSFCRRDFSAGEAQEVILRPVGTTLRLPCNPTAVGLVEVIGVAGTSDLALGVNEWAWDRIDQIDLWPCVASAAGSDVPPTGTYADAYRVTYDAPGTVPDFIVAKTCDMVLRTLIAPTQIEGLASERIGKYAYQYAQFPGGQSPGATVKLTKDDKDELREAGYRPSAATIQLRVG